MAVDAVDSVGAVTAAVARCDRVLRELRRRYPQALASLSMLSAERDGPSDWPQWCWIPMAATAEVVRATGGPPADIGRVAALTAWWTGRGVYGMSEDVGDAAAGEWIEHRRLDRDRLTLGLPEWCSYVVAPPRPLDLPPGTLWVYGVYVHAECDRQTGRPELRLLLDTADVPSVEFSDGGSGADSAGDDPAGLGARLWEGLLPLPVYLDRPTVESAGADWLAVARAAGAGAVGADLRAVPSGLQAQAGVAFIDHAMPYALALTDPAVLLQPHPHQPPGGGPHPGRAVPAAPSRPRRDAGARRPGPAAGCSPTARPA